jgi:hypothetical protein
MRRSLSFCRAGVTGAAAVVLFAACGGGSATDSSATAATAAGTTPESGQGDFCTQAAGLDERVDSALSDAGEDDPSVPDAFRQIATELRGIEAPDEIAADWEQLAGGLDRMADAFADFDVTDPDSLATLDEVEGDLSTASSSVENYLRDECGIDTSDSGPTS